MNRNLILEQTKNFVRQKLSGEGSGHDWWHVHRVRTMALRLAQEEGADVFIVELAALLHDIADWKFHEGNTEAGPKVAREWLQSIGTEEGVIAAVCDIVKDISFKGAGVATPMETIEGKVVQDADRLDAMGAIGIARTCAYGGHKGRAIYDPDLKPHHYQSFEEYQTSEGTIINHFYEKLLLLKDRMNTATARRIAEARHRFMEEYLERFYREWDGEM